MIWLLLAACSPPEPAATPVIAEEAVDRPDILLVTLDTFRVDAMGAYGNRFEPTPNLDALAAAGARFERAYTVTPLTIPAHSSIHTGLYPPRHGVRDNGDFFLSDDANTLAERLSEVGYATMAAVGAEVTSHRWGFAQGFDAYFDDLEPTTATTNRWRVERPGTEVLADAVAWLDEERDQPEFAWVHFFDAHDPYEAPEPIAPALKDRPYLAEIAHVDRLVGELMSHVDDDTVVVVVADHGEGLGEHGEALHGILLYDNTTRIPMLFRAPGVSPQVVSTPASLVDITPTLLGFAGVAHDELDGADHSSALRGSVAWAEERDVYVETLYPWRHFGWAPQHALVDAEYKLIDSTTDKLFARSDRDEQTNLASQSPLFEPRSDRLASMMQSMQGEVVASPVAGDAQLAEQLAALGYATAVVQAPTGEMPDPEDRIGMMPQLESLRTAARAGDLDLTRQSVAALIETEPGLMEPRTILASALLQARVFDEARDVAAEALALQDTAQVRVLLGQAELALGNPAAGLSNLEAAVRMDPGMVTGWLAWLNGLLAVSDAPRLRAESELALQALPSQPEVQAIAGVGLAMTGDIDTAKPILQGLLSGDDTARLVRFGLGTVAQERGDAERAQTLYREEMAAYPPGLPARRHLVALYASQGQYDEQLRELDALIELSPPSPLTLLAKAQALYNLERYADALVAVQSCEILVADIAACVMLKANTLHKLGREDEALTALARARELAGSR